MYILKGGGEGLEGEAIMESCNSLDTGTWVDRTSQEMTCEIAAWCISHVFPSYMSSNDDSRNHQCPSLTWKWYHTEGGKSQSKFHCNFEFFIGHAINYSLSNLKAHEVLKKG